MATAMRLFSTLLIIFMMQACSTINVSQDYDQAYNFSGLKTFSWKANDNNEYGVTNNDLVDKRVRAAMENNLTEKLYTQVDSGKPDFYISYHVTIDQKVSRGNVSGGIGIGRGSSGRYGSISISSGTQARVYDQGTLLIDVTDSATNNLVWRGISSQALSGQRNPEESTELINETVKKVLSQFPPNK